MTLPPTFTSSLICHPGSRSIAASSISALTEFAADGSLQLHYRITGVPAKIALPGICEPGAADNLWQHTCCEAFMATDDGQGYREFNFSPSGQWAVYQFSAYRQRDSDFIAPVAPHISLKQLIDGFELVAKLPPELLPPLKTLKLGLTTILEASDGSKSYWALTHGAGEPDFHHRQSFTLNLPRNTS